MNKIARSLLATTIVSCFFNVVMADTPEYCQYYPHWSDCASSTKLQKIEAFIEKNKANASNEIAAFDWDGTLYSEHVPITEGGRQMVRSGQSAWHLWGAKEILQHPGGEFNYLFPSFKQYKEDGVSINYQAWHDNIENMDDYVEGQFKTISEDQASGVETKGLPQGVYDKFSQIAMFEQGMRFQQVKCGLGHYLKSFPAKNFAFLKMFDLMHRLEVAGFRIWIITGSNPYFVSNLITNDKNGVNSLSDYNVLPQCQALMDKTKSQLSHLTPDQFFQHCTIAGNAAVWAGGKSRFAHRYDDRNFNTAPAGDKLAIDHYGKWFAAQHIVKLEGKPIVLYAGNSDGDYSLMKRVLANAFSAPSGTFGVFVQPDMHGGQDLKYLFEHECQQDACIDVESPE